MSISVRQAALVAIENSFKTITQGQPVADPYTLPYSEVTRLPINGFPPGKRAILGLYAQEERKTSTVGPLKNVSLNCVLEIHISKDAGEHIGDLLETALAEAERRLMEDQSQGGKVIDTNVTGADTNIDGTYANTGEATLFFELIYRHHRDNPADPPP